MDERLVMRSVGSVNYVEDGELYYMPQLVRVGKVVKAAASLVAKSAEHRLIAERRFQELQESTDLTSKKFEIKYLRNIQREIDMNIEIILNALEPFDVPWISGSDRGPLCICRDDHRMAGSMVKCKNDYCPFYSFHSDCVFAEERPAKWLCPVCFNNRVELRCPRQNINRLAIPSSSDPEDSTGL